MITFIAKRFAWMLLVLFVVVSGTFYLSNILPADPAKAKAGAHATDEVVQKVRIQLGLDKPLYVQYGNYLWDLAHLDLGKSYKQDRPVGEIIAETFPNTLILALGAMLFQLLVGVPIGLYSALRAGKPADLAAMSVALVGISAPTFFIGLGLMFLLGYRYAVFPIAGYGDGMWDVLYHAILPSLTLGVSGAAYYSRLTRGEYLEVSSRDYMRTARAKGLDENKVIVKHGLRNALLPLVTFAGLDLGAMLGGAVVTESIFAWPGIGKESVEAVLNKDLPLLLGVVLVASTMIVVANLFVDILYAWLDPRIRYS